MKNSIWMDNLEMPHFPRLEGEKKTDVLVIGGGLCGILSAYFLKWAGIDCCLVEADRIGNGITGRTTAKITVLQGLIYRDLIRKFGRDKAQLYLEASTHSLERYSCMCQKIDCDFQYLPAYTYTRNNRKKIEEEARAIRCIGGDAEFLEQLPLPFAVDGAVKMSRQAQFHPMKFLSEICQDLKIYENTRILQIKDGRAVAETGEITADQIIVTTHFPLFNRLGGYVVKLYQDRSYVIGLSNSPSVKGMYLDEDPQGVSLRNYGDTLLIGGNSHRTGKPSNGWEPLRAFAEEYYPDAKEEYAWSTQDCMSLDGIPYIGRYSWRTPDLYVATGFNKWGMISSMTAALVLRDMVLKRKNDFAKLFSPRRSILHRQLFVNGIESVWGLLTPSVKRCPHLGCALVWNKAEHSWDCPCHGSRFSSEGKLLDNPANGSLPQD